ncbi:hypothetical protein [Marinicella meishanensis]|uniref:hypothetical protein n=1 Tax=Marinicella meishanensis TaxID=2873263 RepID=UPI001CC199E7|nr:hypothetical protein [Marinicella sp. NBU2979]
MNPDNCPNCYTPLEIREVTPCFVCGAWEGQVERLNDSMPFTEYHIESGHHIILCDGCYLEEFLALQGHLASALNLPQTANTVSGFTITNLAVENKPLKDKYCPNCMTRWALLKIIGQIKQPS